MLSEYTSQETEVASTYHGIAWTADEFTEFNRWLSERDSRIRADQIEKDAALVERTRLTLDDIGHEAETMADALRAQPTEGESDE